MIDIQIDEETVNDMLEKAVNEKVDELAKVKYFMTYQELEKYLSISRPTIEEHLIKNGMPYYKAGSKYLFARHEVDEFMNNLIADMSATNNDLKQYHSLKGDKWKW